MLRRFRPLDGPAICLPDRPRQRPDWPRAPHHDCPWLAQACPGASGADQATYTDRTVSWICPDDPTHPTYTMFPVTRVKKPVGCPICRKKKPAASTRQMPALASEAA